MNGIGMRFVAVTLAVMCLAGVAASSESREFDPVVYIEVALGYQGGELGGSLGYKASGSGFVIDAGREIGVAGGEAPACAGASAPGLFVVTNEHVVRSANEVTITFLREEEGGNVQQVTVPAEVVRVDAIVDLGLLRVSPSALAKQELDPALVPRMSLFKGRQEDLARGAEVDAVGNPRGLKRSVTRGVVSSAQQEVTWRPFRMVQTDAAINYGNSGGPLVLSATGEAVGVNSMIYGSSGAMNIGLAIPARRVHVFLRQVLCEGRARHTRLLAEHVKVDERIQSVLGLAAQAGEVVVRKTAVVRGPADPLQEMDVVLQVSGRRVPAAGGGEVTHPVGTGGVPFDESLFDLDPAVPARFQVWRFGKTEELTVPLTEGPEGVMDRDHYVKLLGAYLEDIPESLRLGSNFEGEGVLVGAVTDGSLAAEAGLRGRDVLQAILQRTGAGLVTRRIPDCDALRRIAADIEGEVRSAREGKRALLVGFQVFNASERKHDFRFLRLQEGAVP